MMTPPAGVLKPGAPRVDVVEMIRVAMSDLRAQLGSWRVDEGDDESGCVDPQVVAALEWLAASLRDDRE